MILYPERAAANYLGGEQPLSIKTMQRWRLDGRGPSFIKVGRLVRYSQESLDQYLAGQVRRSTSDQECR